MEKEYEYSLLYIGDRMNSMSLYILGNYKSFEEWENMYETDDEIQEAISGFIYLEVSEMYDDEELPEPIMDKMISQYVKDNYKEIIQITKQLYQLNHGCYVD